MMVVSDLHVWYGGTHAVRGANLSLGAGEIVSVLGPNGAGKSSLLRAIVGITPATSGSVQLDGVDLSAMNVHDRVRHGIALCPEGRQLFETLTVAENLRMGALRVGVSWRALQAELAQLTELFPILGQRWRQRAGTLSGGEQQMVALARGLISRPRVLLLDEPSLGLAPKVEPFVKSRSPGQSGPVVP